MTPAQNFLRALVRATITRADTSLHNYYFIIT